MDAAMLVKLKHDARIDPGRWHHARLERGTVAGLCWDGVRGWLLSVECCVQANFAAEAERVRRLTFEVNEAWFPDSGTRDRQAAFASGPVRQVITEKDGRRVSQEWEAVVAAFEGRGATLRT